MTTVSLQNLTLVTNKKLTNLQDAVIRQSEKGLTITAVFLNEDSSPYDLTNKKVTFNEHKDSDKYVVDTNVQITDERNGAISYTLHPQCYAATGEAWFEIADASGTVVNSTQNFNLKVKDAANASIYNTNYITQLDALRDQMQKLVDGADGQLKQQLKTTQDQMNQKLTELGNAYQIAEQGRANAYKQAEANRDSGWSQDKQRIDNEWNQDKDRINGEWNSQKQSIQNTANSQQSSISSQWSQLKSNADSQLATIQSNINALQATIDDINKNKVPGFNSSLQSAQDKLDKILASLGNFVVSANDVNSISSDKVAEIAGNLIDPNLNNWTKNDPAKQAFKTIDFDTVSKSNNVSFTSVIGCEILYYKITVKQYSNYRLRFRFTPKSAISTTVDNFQACVWRSMPALDTSWWGEDQGSYNTTSQIKKFDLNKDAFCEIGFYSDNASELYVGFNLSHIANGTSCDFELSSLSVVNVDDTISSLPKTVQGAKPDANGNIILPNQQIAKNFDKNGNANLVWLGYGGYAPVDAEAIKDILKNQLPNKYAGKNIVNISNPMFYSTQSVDDFTAMGSPNKTQALTVYRSDFNANDDGKPGLANYSQGIIFGAWTGRGVLSISNGKHKARIAGGTYPGEENGGQVWSEDIAWKSDFANYYNKSEIDTKTSDLQIQNAADTSNLRMRCDNLETRCKNLENRCSNLETQLNVLQGQMADLLGAISISGDTLQINKKLAVRGNITTYWDGADQFVVYSGHNARRGYFGMYDSGAFKVNG